MIFYGYRKHFRGLLIRQRTRLGLLLVTGMLFFAVVTPVLAAQTSSTDPLDNWHSRNTLPQTRYMGVTYGNGTFVAVGPAIDGIATIVQSDPIVLPHLPDDPDVINYPAKSDVPSDKTWTITFNGELDVSMLLGNHITVTNSQNKVITVVVALGSNGKSIIVNPPQGGYTPSETYTIAVAKGLTSKTGKLMNKSYRMQFSVSGVVDPIVAATNAVDAAEAAKTQAAVDVAQLLVTALPTGTIKDGLQARINAIPSADVTVNVSVVIPAYKQITVKQTNVLNAAKFSIDVAGTPSVTIGGTITVNTGADTVKLSILDANGDVLSSGDLNVKVSGDSRVYF